MRKIYRERFRKLAALLRESDSYDQTMWVHHCGAPACIAGHAAVLSLREDEMLNGTEIKTKARGVFREDVVHRAGRWLGLSQRGVECLFFPNSTFWPAPYDARFSRLKTAKARARCAADLCEAIADGKVVLE